MDRARPENLKEYIHTILHGTKEEKAALHGKEFFLADTPHFMKTRGLSGEYFSVKYKKITHHNEKEKGRKLTEDAWIALGDEIVKPFAIAKYGAGFRLYTNAKVDDQWVAVGIDVKLSDANQSIEVNAIRTAFGFGEGIAKNIMYISPDIKEKQLERLKEHNPHFNPAALMSPYDDN
jgi:hypothetical protein